MEFPQDVKYTKSHEWIKKTGDVYIMGITEYAQKQLSDVVYIELPAVGKSVKAGDVIAVVESVKAAFDIYAPITGTVSEVNNTIEDNPALVNSACYTDGWFVKMTASDENEMETLMDATMYATHVTHE